MTLQLPIEDPALLERLAMTADDFEHYLGGLLDQLPPRHYEPAILARALGYPGARPDESFYIADGQTHPLSRLTRQRRDEVCKEFIEDDGREALIAIGANGAPETLRQKFDSLPDPKDQKVLALAGQLHDFDVCAAAVPPLAGPIPATLTPSPGTAVRTSLLWVTAAQLTQLAWSELTYLLGELRTRFIADDVDLEMHPVRVFISRFGCLRLDGQPVALAAVPARSRRFQFHSQQSLLDRTAELILGPDTGAAELLQAAFQNPAIVIEGAERTIRGQALPFRSELWTRFPE